MNTLQELGQKAVTAKYEVQKLSTEKKKRALKAVAKALIAESGEILNTFLVLSISRILSCSSVTKVSVLRMGKKKV